MNTNINHQYLEFLGLDKEDETKDIIFGLIYKKYVILKRTYKNNPEMLSILDDILSYYNENPDKIYSLMDKPTEIYPRVFIGSAKFAMNSDMLKEYGITHILSIAEEFPARLPSFINKNLGIPDTRNILLDINKIKESIEFITSVISNSNSNPENNLKNNPENNKVLIHCQYGRTRSAIVATAFLSKIHNIDILLAYEKLKTIRNVMIPECIIEKLRKLEN